MFSAIINIQNHRTAAAAVSSFQKCFSAVKHIHDPARLGKVEKFGFVMLLPWVIQELFSLTQHTVD